MFIVNFRTVGDTTDKQNGLYLGWASGKYSALYDIKYALIFDNEDQANLAINSAESLPSNPVITKLPNT